MMDAAEDTLYTEFAPAERATLEELERLSDFINQDELADALLQAIPGYVMLINQQRQIVAVNKAMLCATGVSNSAELVGRRPGEALNCTYSCDTPGGCGTSEHCSVCGAVLAILESQQTAGQINRECHMTFKESELGVTDLKATATPIVIKGESFIIFAFQDISNEKRRDVLERTFFHDVLNTAGGIHGLANLLAEQVNISSHVEDEYKNWLVEMSGNLVEEIQHQRKLLMAERGEYQPQLSQERLLDILEDVIKLYKNHDRVPGRELTLVEAPDCSLLTDRPVLRRIIGNMVINALEATPMGGMVTISSTKSTSNIFINVHNAGVMSQDIQLQLFMRSFSTKSNLGRGIGTYSMKLFGERYLKGKVYFRSNQEEGTIFTLSLPLES